MTDQNRKTLRHFQCRDYLWEIFVQMSQELECSVDYLVNESMRQYARSRNYGTRPGTVSTASAPHHTGSVRSSPGIPSIGSAAGQPRAVVPPAQPPAAPPPRQSSPGVRAGAPTPPPPTQGSVSTPGTAFPGGSGAHMRESNPPPLPSNKPPAPAGTMPLYVVFNGQKIPVNKSEFVIGRGSKTADLPIRDGNISRRHCAIVLQGNEYWMKDLGSTNGIEFAGKRVDAKRIEEGDVFQLCDYELRFTYR